MASVSLTLDTTPPVAASLAVVGPDGLSVLTLSSDAVVLARLTCAQTPEELTGEFKLWGDVDPAANGNIQTLEQDSTWTTYSEAVIAVRLSGTAGAKALRARLRDDLHNPTAELAAQVLYDPTYPSVAVVDVPDRTRLSQQAGFDTCTLSWAPNVAVVEYQVRAVSSAGSSVHSGSPIGTAHGSTGVAGTGTYPGGTPRTTTVNAADLVAASPGDGPKVVKVFVRTADERWSL